MTYREARDKFESTPQFSATCTLSRIKQLLEMMGHPENNLKIIHVAGTNGKGSTSTMTARILEEHGFKTGLFLSPYVVTFCERVSINGMPIPENRFAALAERVLILAEQLDDKANFFDLITALSLLYFSEEGCDYAVLEVGMGGRLDATNAISAPLVAAITPISLDHTAFLGNTVGEIAAEKCGILKPGCIAVTSRAQPDDAMEEIRRRCEALSIPLLIPSSAQACSATADGTQFMYRDKAYSLQLLGAHQIDNACTVLAICEALRMQGVDLDDDLCASGMRRSTLPARMEVLNRHPLCILDGGHNPAGVSAFFGFLSENKPQGRLITVFGCLEDKGYPEMCRIVSKGSDVVIATACPSPRSAAYSTLAPYLIDSENLDIPDNQTALETAFSLATEEDLIAICGSLYLAGNIKQILAEHPLRQDMQK